MKDLFASPEFIAVLGLLITPLTQLGKRYGIKPEHTIAGVTILLGIVSVLAQEYIDAETLAKAAAGVTSAVGVATMLYMALKGEKGLKSFDEINKK